jgi:hypothetical protein
MKNICILTDSKKQKSTEHRQRYWAENTSKGAEGFSLVGRLKHALETMKQASLVDKG